jgi:hypothetical protein
MVARADGTLGRRDNRHKRGTELQQSGSSGHAVFLSTDQPRQGRRSQRRILSTKPENSPLMRLYALTDLTSKTNKEAELIEAERRIDDILKTELQKHAKREVEAAETAALGLATHRLEHSIVQRRATLDGTQHRPFKREPDNPWRAAQAWL